MGIRIEKLLQDLLGKPNGAATLGADGLITPSQTDVTILKGQVCGLNLRYDSAIQVTLLAGVCRDDTNAVSIPVPETAITSANLDTGAWNINTWYHVWVAEGTSGVKVLFSLSATSPTLPAGYNQYKRRVGAVKTNGYSLFVKFIQTGTGIHRRYDHQVDGGDVRILAGGTAATFTSVSSASWMPTTASVGIYCCRQVGGGGPAYVMNLGNTSSTSGAVPVGVTQYPVVSFVNNSQTIQYRVSAGGACTIDLIGWEEEL